jgi:hypothetical protein
VVTSTPSQADVHVDGRAAGKTPLFLRVTPGKHTLEVSRPRYENTVTVVESAGRVNIALRRPPATLRVVSSPSAGCAVTIAGEGRGKTPVDVSLAGFERYTVEVARSAGRPWRQHVYLKPPATRLTAPCP